MAETVEGAALAALLGRGGEKLEVAGVTLNIRPLNLAQIADVLPIIDRLAERGVVVRADLAAGVTQGFDPVKLVLRGGREALEVIAVAVSDQEKYLEDAEAEKAAKLALVAKLDPMQAARVVGTVWRVNSDFFDQNRAAILEALAPVLGDASKIVEALVLKAVSLIGRLQSTPSSPEDTASPTSAATASGS